MSRNQSAKEIIMFILILLLIMGLHCWEFLFLRAMWHNSSSTRVSFLEIAFTSQTVSFCCFSFHSVGLLKDNQTSLSYFFPLAFLCVSQMLNMQYVSHTSSLYVCGMYAYAHASRISQISCEQKIRVRNLEGDILANMLRWMAHLTKCEPQTDHEI